MEINILQLIEGAREARGLTVIIDVFRAFSVACYVSANGVENMIPVGRIEEAYRLKEEHPDYILMGERGGVIQPGFDYGNSPKHAEHVDFTGKTVVHTTSAGTQGIVNAVHADEIVTGSFVNAGAIVEYIRRRKPEQVSLVCMGWNGTEHADEDTLCAEYIKNALEGKENRFDEIVRYLREESRTGSFLDVRGEASELSAPREDFDLCLQLDRFSFVLKVERDDDGTLSLRKIPIL
ncbi:2-phosphosulfolactate phosphatase [Paenibacillus thermotolerans]|uniref:2-phosphosulfolactate phosphatase n=1 Tax=Paenibacillus thermotolerans TaxID=3027807 RepID=UPI0023688C2F|nr:MULTISPECIES: 2-phosphosulfolactate phosphatase [unclassified Paenibacillus]